MNVVLDLALKFLGPSWRTSIFGWFVILGNIGDAILATGLAGKAILDNDPATQFSLESVVQAWSAVAAGIALLFVRDSKVTSEAAGAK